MYLKNIKLAGFKTFVDAVTIPLSAQRVAIVGPNGCGKSNVIDAVRWVLGESSAKYLRGESIVDVIFNGSSERKPVGQASIELLFDNGPEPLTPSPSPLAGAPGEGGAMCPAPTSGRGERRIGGEYAAYQEISIKRELRRDGKSTFYLNGTPCRRRDVIDIFLGTGLGPRNYAIIEQDTAHLVEAKPEVLRAAIEEAAGISKYKDRRSETERRIEDTRENLARLSDLRQEIEKQLSHLQKQANTAQRYRQLKEEEREFRTKLFNARAMLLNQQLNVYNKAVEDLAIQFEAAQTENGAFDTTIHALREKLQQLQATVTQKQSELHQIDIEVTKLIQAQAHQTERKAKLEIDKEQTITLLKEAEQQVATDQNFIEQILKSREEMQYLLTEANEKQNLSQEEEQVLKTQIQTWQNEWDAFQKIAAQTQREADVEQMRVSQLEAHLLTLSQQLNHLTQEAETLTATQKIQTDQDFPDQLQNLQTQIENLTAEVGVIHDALQKERLAKQSFEQEIRNLEQTLQALRESYASLDALQKVALGQQNSARVEWLKEFGLSERPRLVQLLQVTSGWERALEVVLGFHLEAVCIEDEVNFLRNIERLPEASFSVLSAARPCHFDSNSCHPDPRESEGKDLVRSFVAKDAPQDDNVQKDALQDNGVVKINLPLLKDQVKTPFSLGNLLQGVYIAQNLEKAWNVRDQLKSHESIVTPEGIWIGPHWLRIQREPDEKMGVIARERELTLLKEKLTETQSELTTQQNLLEKTLQILSTQEQQKQEIEQQLATIKHQQAEIRGQWQAQQAENERVLKRLQTVKDQHKDLLQVHADQESAIAAAKKTCQQAIDQINQQLVHREEFLKQREAYQDLLAEKSAEAQALRLTSHEIALKVESLTAQMHATSQHAERLQKQLSVHQGRLTAIEMEMQQIVPQDDDKESLESLNASHQALSTALADLKQLLNQFYQEETVVGQQKSTAERLCNSLRDQLERERLAQNATEERFAALKDQMREVGCELDLDALSLDPSPASGRGEDGVFSPGASNASERVEYDEAELEERLNKIQNRIISLGAINLAAVEEFEEQQKRKIYLDEQNDDLVTALDALENAIRQIDQETRQRFKETFDAINVNFQKFFPRLFGGGQAKLTLVEQDWLTSGVQVMAQPPGKRNSTVHLLSGGEKALTAIALVFSLFELNPAPFCILDEIDAPLDDANVGRFCNLVKEMSEHIQFIFITHNKVAMEMAQHLIGVTMHEPGVSRLVAVDVDQAMDMVASSVPA